MTGVIVGAMLSGVSGFFAMIRGGWPAVGWLCLGMVIQAITRALQ